MKILDLFSGIGGFSYAAERLVGGFETVAFCEQDEFCKKILNKHWPTIPIINDVKELADNADEFRGIVDIVCGGFPCQPVSVAGLQRADQDDRYLWEEMFRVIQGCKPRWVIAENVTGLINIKGGILFEQVQTDLESEGYSVQSIVLPAASKNAPHRRDRIWIIGYSEHNGLSSTKVRGKHEENGRGASQGQKKTEQSEGTSKQKSNVTMAHPNDKGLRSRIGGSDSQSFEKGGKRRDYDNRSCTNGKFENITESQNIQKDVADTDSQRGRGRQTRRQDAENVRQSSEHQRADGERMETGQSESSLCGVDDGLPTRLDGFDGWDREPEDIPRVATSIKNRTERLKSLGNSIVPQVVAEIFREIKETEQ